MELMTRGGGDGGGIRATSRSGIRGVAGGVRHLSGWSTRQRRGRAAVAPRRRGVAGDASRRRPFMKVREVIKLIEADGWRMVRQRSSHRQYHHPTKPGTVTVAG